MTEIQALSALCHSCPLEMPVHEKLYNTIAATLHRSQGRRCRSLSITEVKRLISILTANLILYCKGRVFFPVCWGVLRGSSKDPDSLGVFCNITYGYRKFGLMMRLNLPALCLQSLCFSFSVALLNLKLSKQEGWSDSVLIDEYWLFSSTTKRKNS